MTSLLVALMAAVACVSPEPAATSVGATSSTSTPGFTTATTTASSGSTATTLPTTTTAAVLEGNWAEQPVVTSGIENVALGWWGGSNWVDVEEGMALPIKGGEDYQVALLGTEGLIVTGGPRVSGCANGLEFDLPGIELDHSEALSFFLESDPSGRGPVRGVAISAPWDITPRPVTRGEAHPDLESIAVDLLADRGFALDEATIVQTVDADLDGDGALETVVVAEETELGNEGSGVYSVVFAMSPAWSGPLVVEESVIPPGESGFPASFRVGAVADLSGDRIMELVIHALAWENDWVAVFEVTEVGFLGRMSAGCGV